MSEFGKRRAACYRKDCYVHYIGAYDRRKDGVEDRRTDQSSGGKPPYRRGAIYDPTKPRVFGPAPKPSAVGRRAGDFERFQSQAHPKPVLIGVDLAVESAPERSIKDRRNSAGGRRVSQRRSGVRGYRRQGPVDRRVINTWGAPARRHIVRGRRAGDVSYNKLPRATPPAVKAPAPKPTLKEAVTALRVRPKTGVTYGDWIKADAVLDLLKDYGVEDA